MTIDMLLPVASLAPLPGALPAATDAPPGFADLLAAARPVAANSISPVAANPISPVAANPISPVDDDPMEMPPLPAIFVLDGTLPPVDQLGIGRVPIVAQLRQALLVGHGDALEPPTELPRPAASDGIAGVPNARTRQPDAPLLTPPPSHRLRMPQGEALEARSVDKDTMAFEVVEVVALDAVAPDSILPMPMPVPVPVPLPIAVAPLPLAPPPRGEPNLAPQPIIDDPTVFRAERPVTVAPAPPVPTSASPPSMPPAFAVIPPPALDREQDPHPTAIADFVPDRPVDLAVRGPIAVPMPTEPPALPREVPMVRDGAPLRQPEQPLVLSTGAKPGDVRIGLEGGVQDLRVSLSVAPGHAAAIAADVPRLVADLAASGIRLQSLDVSADGGGDGRPRPPAPTPASFASTFAAEPPQRAPRARSDRYA